MEYVKKNLAQWYIQDSITLELPNNKDKRESILKEIKENTKQKLKQYQPTKIALDIYKQLKINIDNRIQITLFDYINNEIEFEPKPVLNCILKKCKIENKQVENINIQQCYLNFELVNIKEIDKYYLDKFTVKMGDKYKINVKDIYHLKIG